MRVKDRRFVNVEGHAVSERFDNHVLSTFRKRLGLFDFSERFVVSKRSTFRKRLQAFDG